MLSVCKVKSWCFLLLSICCFQQGCKPDHSLHRIVEYGASNSGLDDTYITYLQEQIRRDPGIGENYVKLAEIYTQQRKNDQAITLLEDAREETDEELKVLLGLGKLYLEKEDVANLSKTLKSIRQIDPDNIVFLKLSAGYSVLRNDYTNANFFANRAILFNPYDDESIFLSASAKLVNKDSISALQGFEEAYELKSSANNFSMLFELLLVLDETQKAATYLEEFEQENRSANTCFFRGAYLNEVGQKDSARTVLKSCLDDDFSQGRISFELAKSYFPQQADSVIFYADQYLTSKSSEIPAMVLKAKALELKSYYTEARALYQDAIKLDSTSTIAMDGLNNLERKVAYLRLKRKKEDVQRDLDLFKPLDNRVIN